MELNFKLVKNLILIRKYIEKNSINFFYIISYEDIVFWIFS
jgi:hypothetical protein